MTYSVGWALARSPAFLHAFLEAVFSSALTGDEALIRLQEYSSEHGITDVEVEAVGRFFVIAEAKRGWNLPTAEQLTLYAERAALVECPPERKCIAVFSECSPDYADVHLPFREMCGIRIMHISWRELNGLSMRSRKHGSSSEKHLLDELDVYLRGLMTMQNVDSNRVYVVSLSRDQAPGWNCSWLEIVTVHNLYFHPVGGAGWPKEPPNYLAFRYDSQLQSIHHVEDYEVFTSLKGRHPAVLDDSFVVGNAPHFLYQLGPGFCPSKTVHTGVNLRAGRLWCMLDTLFTSATILEAARITRERVQKAGESDTIE